MSDTTLGETLFNLRSNKGLGLRLASEGIGIRPGKLSKYERGYANPPLKTLCAIAAFYEVDADSLMALAVEPPPMLGKVGIHINGMDDMPDATVAALVELGKATFAQTPG